ncbi:uncharacterized protein BKA78DRAFT_357893 [Phyllosticta capitalensis]|uniref:uncharacterized protein n=1 Tax=Phyllosticta capitalensis TaxID=121624 RepID=UPI003130DF5C
MSPAGSGTPATANTDTKRNRVLQAIRFQAEAGFKKPMRDNDFGMEETREWLFRIWNLRGPPRNTHSCHVSHMSVEPPTSKHAAFQFAKEPYNLPTLPITKTKSGAGLKKPMHENDFDMEDHNKGRAKPHQIPEPEPEVIDLDDWEPENSTRDRALWSLSGWVPGPASYYPRFGGEETLKMDIGTQPKSNYNQVNVMAHYCEQFGGQETPKVEARIRLKSKYNQRKVISAPAPRVQRSPPRVTEKRVKMAEKLRMNVLMRDRDDERSDRQPVNTIRQNAPSFK